MEKQKERNTGRYSAWRELKNQSYASWSRTPSAEIMKAKDLDGNATWGNKDPE